MNADYFSQEARNSIILYCPPPSVKRSLYGETINMFKLFKPRFYRSANTNYLAYREALNDGGLNSDGKVVSFSQTKPRNK